MRKKYRQIVSFVAATSLSFSQILIPQSISDSEGVGSVIGLLNQKKVVSVDDDISLTVNKQADKGNVEKQLGGNNTVLPTKDKGNVSKDLPKNPDNVGKKPNDDNSTYDENGVDYDKIIEEAKENEYRDDVDIASNSFVVVRKEDSTSSDIEDEEWYQKSGATDYVKISQRDDNGEQEVSYKLTIDTDDVWSVVDMVNETKDVLIAEPEYIFKTCDEGVPSQSTNAGMSKQWYLEDQDAKNIWADTTTYGNATGEGVVVAVIDTGVDYNHEDLKNNVWMNTAELLGTEGVDDDGNGYVDDIYGVNFVANSSDPMDDNGHGTHVAGIIAMGDNEAGGVGIAYKSQIMSIKAGGSDGSFNSSDIAKAITYAYKNGADVINMSFGSYAHSAIVEAALQDAFSSCVLVAAAGNDSYPTLDAPVILKGNMYPAAYSYVIGVMAHDKNNGLAVFTNWDYKQNYGAEYEITAPGVEIYSTLPGNRYASWSGTSMAAPMVSAVAAILRSSYSDKSQYSSRFIMGQIVSATEDVTVYDTPIASYEYSKLNLSHSLTKSAKPNINVDEIYIFDTPDISEKNNGDGIVQPGETIAFAVGLRNQWGAATDVAVTINATSDGGVNNPYVTFDNGNEMPIDDVGTFGKQNNGYIYDEHGTVVGVNNPIKVTISEDAPNDANITFNINYHAKNALDTNDTVVYTQLLDTKYTLSVQKGTVLQGKISSDMTLSKDEYYIVQNSLLIPKGVTVNVEPGTQIQFWSNDSASVYGDDNIAYIRVEGNLYFNGSENSPISLFPGKDFEAYQVRVEKANNGKINMDYVNIINPFIVISEANHVNIIQDYDVIYYRDFDGQGKVNLYEGQARIAADKMINSRISNIRGRYSDTYAYVNGSFDTVLFDNCMISYNGIVANNCTFLVNQGRVEDAWSGTLHYYTSKLMNSGDFNMIPQYETVSDIYNINGKKYVFYRFDNYYDQERYGMAGMKSYKKLLASLENNGGTIAFVDTANEDISNMFSDFYNKQDKSHLYIAGGAYFDEETQEVKYTSSNTGNVQTSISKSYPFYSYTIYTSTRWIDVEGESVEESYIYSSGSSGNVLDDYVLAEYPEDVDDYTVLNPNLNPMNLGIAEGTDFKNNAILNRLTNTDTTNWMKVTTTNDNMYIYECTQNYWGTTDSKLVQKQIIDFDTNIRYGDIISEPYLLEPAQSTYPCVSDIYIVDKNGEKVRTVGNGEYEVHVLFNRDMNTEVMPDVTYGPDDPYTDYEVKGSWINEREWVGKAAIKVLVNQGKQLFKVKGAVAKDDSWLVTGSDWGRFEFSIEASGAEALVLQAEALEGAVYLNWTQDEYDTLAGYNVYRSESGETDAFVKVNKSIIDATTKEYTDTSVECGKVYSYYFTIVETDMKESRPSNIVRCASIDNEPPKITVPESISVTYGMKATITATITDNVGVNSAYLYYRMQGEENYNSINMTCSNGNTYAAQIPVNNIKIGTLEFYIVAADSISSGSIGSADEPRTCIVDSKSRITSVVCEGGNVGDTIKATISGVNFDENTQVYIDNEIVSSNLISEKEIQISYIPKFMGKKAVSLYQYDECVSTFNNAFAVCDDTIYVENKDAIVVKNNGAQYIYFSTNFAGKLTSMDITFDTVADESGTQLQYYMYPSVSNYSNNHSYNENYTERTFESKFGNVLFNGGCLFYICIDEMFCEKLPAIKNLKINGVSVKNAAIDMNKVEFIEAENYVPVESVHIEMDSTTYEVGESFKPTVTVEPANATKKGEIQYNYDKSALMLNEDGTFTTLKSEGTYLSVNVGGISSDNGISIYVNPIPVTLITLDKSSYVGTVGEKLVIEANAQPLDSDAYLNWNTLSYYELIECVGSTNNGRKATFLLKEAGNVKVEVFYGDIRKEVDIEILPNEAYTQIDEEIVTLNPNQNYTLTAKILNQSSNEMAIKYKSSNTSVATVSDDGVIHALANGYTIITASVDGGVASDTMILLVGTDSMTYTLGDINMDGKITSTDALLALKLALSGNCNDVYKNIADVNGDGNVSTADSMLILQYVTGVISSFQ